MQHTTTEDSARKRKRLNHACERCRNQRVRCDDRQPRCTRCTKAGADCITRDPRNPGTVVVRHEATTRRPREANSTAVTSVSPVTVIPEDAINARVELSRPPEQTPNRQVIQQPTSLQNSDGSSHALPTEARLPALPRFVNGNSLYILTQWLDLALARLNHGHRFSHLCTSIQAARPLQHVEISPVSGAEIQLAYQQPHVVDRYLTTVHTIFPLLTSDFWTRLGAPSDSHDSSSTTEINIILQALVVATSKPLENGPDSLTRRCLQYAFARLYLILSGRSVEGVVGLILMSIIFRGQNDTEMAFHLLSLASSLSKTLGLHRKDILGSNTSQGAKSHDASSIWWSLYVLDKIVALELERTPLIDDHDCNQELPSNNGKSIILDKLVELSRLQHLILKELHKGRNAEESPDVRVEQVIIEKIRTAGTLDSKLLAWEKSLPFDLRPSEFAFCDPSNLVSISFLATQYYQTCFLISRNAMIVSDKHIQHVTDTYLRDEPFRLRVRNGKALCCNAARSIISLLGTIQDHQAESVFDTLYPPLVANIGLAVNIIRAPGGNNARTDLTLYLNGLKHIAQREENGQMGNTEYPVKLSLLLHTLYPDLDSRVNRYASMAPTGTHIREHSSNQDDTRPLDSQIMDTSAHTIARDSYINDDLFFDIPNFGDGDWDFLAEALDLPSVGTDYTSPLHQTLEAADV